MRLTLETKCTVQTENKGPSVCRISDERPEEQKMAARDE